MNWNISVTLGKEIKRDSMNSENESRISFKVKRVICLNKGEPSSKAKYGIISARESTPWGKTRNSKFTRLL